MKDKCLVVLAGPTASGKTDVAIKIAKALKTVIVSADSRQFYKEMCIGTAVPSNEELLQVRHYYIQNKSILDNFTVADYETEVIALLDHLFKVYDVVVMTGGSGLFIDAVCNGLDNMPDINHDIRSRVDLLFKERGLLGLQKELSHLDPQYYSQVDRQNPRRLMRALEVCYQSGRPFSSFRSNKAMERPFEVVRIALYWERSLLYERINRRVDMMMAQGLEEEARNLLPYRHLNTLNTVGYKELFMYFDGACSREEAVELIKQDTRRYAKRQMTWFKRNDAYRWFDPTDVDNMLALIEHARNV